MGLGIVVSWLGVLDFIVEVFVVEWLIDGVYLRNDIVVVIDVDV